MDEQQWTGQLDLTVFFDGNRSVSRDIFFEKALKVIRPVYLNQSTIPTFYIVNVGGGYLDGDRYRMNVNVEDNAKVTLHLKVQQKYTRHLPIMLSSIKLLI